MVVGFVVSLGIFAIGAISNVSSGQSHSTLRMRMRALVVVAL